jgi:hypothetical protein
VQVSRQELLATRVIELGLARLLQKNRSSVIFPHHSPLHFKRSPSPADRADALCRIVIDHAGSSRRASRSAPRDSERAAVLLAKRERASRRLRTAGHRSAA